VIGGTVTSSAGGAPIAGAKVTTQPAAASATTDSAGNYQLSAAPGTYNVLISAAGYNTNFVPSVAVSNGGTSAASQSLIPVPAQTSEDLFSRPNDPGPTLGTASDGHAWANDLSTYPTCVSSIANQQAYLQAFSSQTDCDTWMGNAYQDSELTVDFDATQVLVDPYHQHGPRILMRVKNASTFVLVAFNPTKGDVTIWTQQGGVWNALASTPMAFSTTTWYHVKADAIGSSVFVKAWAFGTTEPGWLVTTTQETAVTGTGQGGIRAAAADVYFSNFKVVGLTGITGKVSNSVGAVISGAQVQLSNGQTTTTDANGNYSFLGLQAGSYTVTASAAGYSSSSTTVNVSTGVVATANLFLT
jgi:hypothetical protein